MIQRFKIAQNIVVLCEIPTFFDKLLARQHNLIKSNKYIFRRAWLFDKFRNLLQQFCNIRTVEGDSLCMLQVKQHLAVTAANKCTEEFPCFFKCLGRSVASFTRSVVPIGIYNPAGIFSALNGTAVRLNNLDLPGRVFVNF